MLIPVHKLPYPGACKAKGRAAAVVVAHAIVDDDRRDIAGHFWTLRRDGYAQTSISGRRTLMHHMVVPNTIGVDVSHENANPLDNRSENLRYCSRSDNVLNTADRLRRNRKSCQFRGVTRDKKPLLRPWRGKVMLGGVTHQTPRFSTPEEAFEALTKLRAELRVREFPEVANG